MGLSRHDPQLTNARAAAPRGRKEYLAGRCRVPVSCFNPSTNPRALCLFLISRLAFTMSRRSFGWWEPSPPVVANGDDSVRSSPGTFRALVELLVLLLPCGGLTLLCRFPTPPHPSGATPVVPRHILPWVSSRFSVTRSGGTRAGHSGGDWLRRLRCRPFISKEIQGYPELPCHLVTSQSRTHHRNRRILTR